MKPAASPAAKLFGKVKRKLAKLGSARRGTSVFGLFQVRHGCAVLGMARLAGRVLRSAWLGVVGSGVARQCRLGSACQGGARPGPARLGPAGTRLGSARLAWRGESRFGAARRGVVWLGRQARRGPAAFGKAGCAVHGKAL